MYIIGDVHGRFTDYFDIIQKLGPLPPDCGSSYQSIQLGDMEIGFPQGNPERWEPEHVFFRGNHDNPYVCKKHPNSLADYGLIDSYLFYCAGAKSIDAHKRIKGRDWWPDEELSWLEIQEVIDLYNMTKPEIVVTHDCPFEIMDRVKNIAEIANPAIAGWGPIKPYLQVCGYDVMLQIHRPKRWIFGHWHCEMDFVHEGTRFQCVPTLGVLEL